MFCRVVEDDGVVISGTVAPDYRRSSVLLSDSWRKESEGRNLLSYTPILRADYVLHIS